MTETTQMSTENSANKLWCRRDVIKLLGATAFAGPMILRGTTANATASKVIKIGHVSSPTGVFAPVAEADPFILGPGILKPSTRSFPCSRKAPHRGNGIGLWTIYGVM